MITTYHEQYRTPLPREMAGFSSCYNPCATPTCRCRPDAAALYKCRGLQSLSSRHATRSPTYFPDRNGQNGVVTYRTHTITTRNLAPHPPACITLFAVRLACSPPEILARIPKAAMQFPWPLQSRSRRPRLPFSSNADPQETLCTFPCPNPILTTP